MSDDSKNSRSPSDKPESPATNDQPDAQPKQLTEAEKIALNQQTESADENPFFDESWSVLIAAPSPGPAPAPK